MIHLMPLVLITTDWCLCDMRYELSSVWINMGIVSFYGVVNITVTKVSGKPIYPPFITWDTPLHWLIGLGLLPLFLGVYLL